jgi:hypothetical protein
VSDDARPHSGSRWEPGPTGRPVDEAPTQPTPARAEDTDAAADETEERHRAAGTTGKPDGDAATEHLEGGAAAERADAAAAEHPVPGVPVADPAAHRGAWAIPPEAVAAPPRERRRGLVAAAAAGLLLLGGAGGYAIGHTTAGGPAGTGTADAAGGPGGGELGHRRGPGGDGRAPGGPDGPGAGPGAGVAPGTAPGVTPGTGTTPDDGSGTTGSST